jgi:hypothetical protein
MRLVNFGAGEIGDRLSILALKILYGREGNQAVTHFEKERAVLLTKIAARTLGGSWFEYYTELATVNAAIWQNEDKLRQLRKEAAIWDKPDSTGLTGAEDLKRLTPVALLTAFRSQELNDRRAELIELINKVAGDGETREKLP